MGAAFWSGRWSVMNARPGQPHRAGPVGPAWRRRVMPSPAGTRPGPGTRAQRRGAPSGSPGPEWPCFANCETRSPSRLSLRLRGQALSRPAGAAHCGQVPALAR